MNNPKEGSASTQNIPLHDPGENQRTASDPLISSWVNASAGSGKTKVLTDRMLRLLLPAPDGRPGAYAHKILALTFTKAGANEMSLRLNKRLSRWAVMTESDLNKDMEDNLLGRTPTDAEIRAARKLFARVMDAPGGLKIMTIHSFCQSVLGRFPIEAGLSPDFRALEESDSRELLIRARKVVLDRVQTAPASPLSLAVDHVARMMNEDQITQFLGGLNSERNQLEQILSRTFGLDGLYSKLCTLLDIRPDQTEQDVWNAFFEDDSVEGFIRSTCAALAESKSAADSRKGLVFQAYWDGDIAQRAILYPAYKEIFLTAKGSIAKTIVTKAVMDGFPELIKEAERLLAFEEVRKKLSCARLTYDSLFFGIEVLKEYEILKTRLGALDYDDMILKTLALLKGSTQSLSGLGTGSPWVLYKLDGGLDHILVDEAQDTNPEQWDIIGLLSQEFFSGLNAREETIRTFFVVGDEKQSIFSFQRAAPDKFGDMFKIFQKNIRESGQVFSPVEINTSFRSVQIVLDAVDSVFANHTLTAEAAAKAMRHIAYRQGQGGIVELWPIFKNEVSAVSGEEDEAWSIPVDIQETRSGSLKLSDKIGDTIATWLANKDMLESYGRPIQAGDIMILVRSRNAFVNQLVRALKTRHIPVSGIDRMILSNELVIEDLCACADFALLPDDDLTLAGLLKSPFIGFDEEKLYQLCQPRTGTLWQSLKDSGEEKTVLWLERLIEEAGRKRPYEFFSRLTQEPCPADEVSGIRAIRRRLGEDAIDPLDEFFNLSLQYETSHVASLQSFLKWHREGKSEIKRQLEEGGDSVRIMTVHGSKGLQAPIVFLPDTVRTSQSSRTDRILWPDKTGFDIPLVSSVKDDAPAYLLEGLQIIQQKQDEEYRRLLYVAMTRAEERLYVAGYSGKRSPSDNSQMIYWYDDLRRALEGHQDITQHPSGYLDETGTDVPLLRLQAKPTSPADKKGMIKDHTDRQKIHPVPDYFYKMAPEEPFPPRPLVPSRPSDAEPAATSPRSVFQTMRFKRGTITHKLLQHLPDIALAKRQSAAESFVAQPVHGLSKDIQDQIVAETMAILNDRIFAPIFGPGSMAEIPVTGFLDGKTLVSGQIDRLIVTEHDVLIIDFKTNRPPPLREEDVQPIYRRQMQAYARVLKDIYPDRRIRCALLWTDGPRLMEINVSE